MTQADYSRFPIPDLERFEAAHVNMLYRANLEIELAELEQEDRKAKHAVTGQSLLAIRTALASKRSAAGK